VSDKVFRGVFAPVPTSLLQSRNPFACAKIISPDPHQCNQSLLLIRFQIVDGCLELLKDSIAGVIGLRL
jgi:hypothetical protein